MAGIVGTITNLSDFLSKTQVCLSVKPNDPQQQIIFYCDLYLPREGDCEYSTLKFGENFCLTSGFESGSTKYYEGSHLIEAIRDRDYLQNVLSRLNKCSA